jgi:hypothetical protein
MIESDVLDKNSGAGMALGARWQTPATDLNKRLRALRLQKVDKILSSWRE